MTTAEPNASRPPQEKGFIRVLGALERVGNKLPHPFWLFLSLGAIVLILSAILSQFDIRAVSPEDDETIHVVNLLDRDGLQEIVAKAVENFTSFPPLGLIIIVMLGVAIAEHSGLIGTAIQAVVSRVSARWLTFVLALAGVTGSVASDAIYVVLIPLGAAAFKAAGRSAVLGAVVAFGAASAGYNASLLLTGTDAILAGLSTSAAQVVDESYVVSPVSNYFFSMASAIVLALIITVVAELVLARIAERGAEHEEIPEDVQVDSTGISAEQVRALKWAGVTALASVAAYMLALFLPGSVFVGDDGVLDSPLLTDIVVPIALLFGFSGLVYGLLTRSITSPTDVPVMMGKGIVSLGPVIVLFFAAAQFVAYFRWSNIGSILAIKGSEVLEAWDLPPLVMFFGLVLLVAALNFFITSGSAQYALMAPVIVPMFMLIDVQPEVTQMLFRMGDSPTNLISPMSPYFALALGYLQQYNRKAGIGTLFSLTLPISIAVLLGWFLFFCVWYLFGLPLGPGIPIR